MCVDLTGLVGKPCEAKCTVARAAGPSKATAPVLSKSRMESKKPAPSKVW